MNKLPRTEKLSYLWAFVAVAVAFGVRWVLDPWVIDDYTFWFFVPAVAVAAWNGGFLPGLVATVLSVGAGIALLQIHTWNGPDVTQRTGILLFSVSCLFVLGAVQGLRKSLRKEIVQRPVVEPAPVPVRRELDRDRNFKTIFDNIHEAAVITMDANRTIREWNVGATQLTGWSRGEMIGRSADELFNQDDRQKGEPGLEQLVAETQGKAGFSRWLMRRDGSQFLAEGTLRTMPGEYGDSSGFIKFFFDVTAKVQKYEDAVASMVDRAKDAGDLTYTMAHDMRQYTRGLAMNAEMIVRDLDNTIPDDQKHALNRLRQNATRLHGMVEAILENLRLGRLDMAPKPINLSELAEKAVNKLRETGSEGSVRFIIQPGLWVKGDSELLEILCINLFENAAKYGTGKAIFGHDATKDAFYVYNEGPGFDPQYKERIFKLFERLHGQEIPGTGIGLANVRKIVERHGGKIWAESEPGKGATFYFTLKSSDQAPVGTLR